MRASTASPARPAARRSRCASVAFARRCRRAGSLICLPAALLVVAVGARGQSPSDPAAGLTLVAGIRVGHYSYPGAATGCTVVLADGAAIGAGDVRGGAPGTVETALLDPVNTVKEVNAVLLAGGSAYGLAARDGVMRHLEERGEGYAVGSSGVVPIVPGAVIFDLGVASARPGPECGRRAAEAATSGAVAEGSVGAGAGATVGKLRGMERAMKGGVGTAAIALEGGLVVAALVVVNALGDIVDPATGQVVAGVRGEGDRMVDARRILREDGVRWPPGGNTTIGVVATNAPLSRAEAARVAQMAHDGIARAIVPSHTPDDGDTLFALATGTLTAPGFTVGQVGALAAEAVADAILRAVQRAHGLAGLPAVRDLPPPPLR